MRVRTIIIILLFLNSAKIHGQTVLLQVDRGNDSLISVRGPNMKKFIHFFFFAGMVAGSDQPGARIKYGTSADLGMGVRWKYKLGKIYSLGYETRINYLDYKLRQEAGKTVPDSMINDKERLDFFSLQLGFYNRFNFDPDRGNNLGHYLDLGIRGEWGFNILHIVKNELPDGSYAASSISSLPYVNHLNYELFARIGLRKLSLYATYRPSDLFKSSYNYPEMPRLTMGLELAIFSQ